VKLKIVSWMVMRDRGLNTEKSNNGSSLSTDQLSVVIFSEGTLRFGALKTWSATCMGNLTSDQHLPAIHFLHMCMKEFFFH